MTASPNTWIDYWRSDDLWSRSKLWQTNAARFLRRAEAVVGFRQDDIVLDIGCGAGHLERLLAPRVARIEAADVAEAFLEQTRANCRGLSNVRTRLLGDAYTDLSVCAGPFSLILCVSVVQYYRDAGEIEALVRSARGIAAPDARMLIADLPRRRGPAGFIWDAACSLWTGLREGYATQLFGAAGARWLRRSGYKARCGAREPLEFTLADVQSLAQRIGPDASVVRAGLSVYAHRPSLLIQMAR